MVQTGGSTKPSGTSANDQHADLQGKVVGNVKNKILGKEIKIDAVV